MMSELEHAVAAQLLARGIGVSPLTDDGRGPDLVFEVPGPDGPQTVVLEFTSAHLGKRQRAVSSDVVMVAEEYVSPRRAQHLRAQGVPFVDSVGNMWLSVPGLTIEVEGRPRPAGWSERRKFPADRLSRPSSLRVIFTLLTMPASVRLTLRDLATLCHTSVGATQATIADLGDQGFLTGSSTTRRLRQTGALADRWVSQFRSRLLPKLDRLVLRGPAPSFWFDQLDLLRESGAVLGGEAACEIGGYPIRSIETLVYGVPPWGPIRMRGRLGQDGSASVILRERFWPPEIDGSRQRAPALLTYTDLLDSGEPRLLRMADEMRQTDDELRRLWAS